MTLYLARDSTGYMLTAQRPNLCPVRGTDRYAWYAREGEPIAVRHLCEEGVRAILGQEFNEGEVKRVELTMTLLELVRATRKEGEPQ